MRTLPAAALLLVAAIACKDATTAPDLTEYAGNYVMRTINGNALPFTVLTTTDVKLEITSDTMFLSSNGAFRDVTRYRRTTNGVVDLPADTLLGDWTIRGQTVTISTDNGFEFRANLVGNTMTIEGTGVTTVYTR